MFINAFSFIRNNETGQAKRIENGKLFQRLEPKY